MPNQKLSLTAIAIFLLIVGIFASEIGQSAMHTVLEKIDSFGGPARRLQFAGLIQGIHDDWMLGGGHTAHVDYVRDPVRPWRYELLPLALIYRVGLIGFLIYMYPVMSSFWRMGHLVRVTGRQNQVDIFFVVGLLATMLRPPQIRTSRRSNFSGVCFFLIAIFDSVRTCL